MAVKLTGTNMAGETVEVMVFGDMIYDDQGGLTVDPSTLVTGDRACTTFGCPGITLTADAEIV